MLASLVLFLLLLTTVVFSSKIHDGLFVFKEIWFLLVISIVLVYILSFYKYNISLEIKIKLVDIYVLLYFCYVLVNDILKIESKFLAYQTCVLTIGLMLTYFSIRKMIYANSLTKHGITQIFYVVTLVQVVMGFLQLYKYIPSNHNTFLVTGGFFNPGPYAIYLSSLVVFIMPLLLYFFRKRKKSSIILTSTLLISSLLLIAYTNSRASWISLLFGFLFIFSCFFGKELLKFYKSIQYKIIE